MEALYCTKLHLKQINRLQGTFPNLKQGRRNG